MRSGVPCPAELGVDKVGGLGVDIHHPGDALLLRHQRLGEKSWLFKINPSGQNNSDGRLRLKTRLRSSSLDRFRNSG